MGKLLWEPSEKVKKQANMTRFIDFVTKKYNLQINSYFQLYKRSIENIPDFWAAMWDFGELIASCNYDHVVDDLRKFPGAKWFPGARLNFAENLLRFRDNHVAFIFRGETKKSAKMTYAELYIQVAQLTKTLHDLGVAPGDRVVAYMPNLIETAVAMLAATSLGAIWASCGAELGPNAVLDRFSQIEPKILFTASGYFYKGKTFNSLHNVEQVAKSLPSLEKVIVATYGVENPNIRNIPNSVHYDAILDPEKQMTIQFEQLPFEHPVYIMFTSGTTGKPKCLVQGAGGILINQLKDLILHIDLKREDKITFTVSPSWMVWNWLLSALAVGTTIVLYDGAPFYPDWGAMWKLIQDEKITIFGCSASYINYLMNVGANPGTAYNLSSLREIPQTASALSADGFEWVYREIKTDFHFNSMAGGTDINGGFFQGSAILPVYAGELQSPALGMKVKAYDELSNSVEDQKAELVCEAPTPSMPLYFWNDPGNKRYNAAYFDFYKPMGKMVWRHGDYIIIHSDTGGTSFYGRSDAVLKPSGVRIGTAEIYEVVEKLPEIMDSLTIGQDWKGDQRILLFVKLAPNYSLTKKLKNQIRSTLREHTSPRHVPAAIFETPDIPYTFSMKKVEIAVTNIIHGRPVTNREALTNPESLDYFERILPDLIKSKS